MCVSGFVLQGLARATTNAYAGLRAQGSHDPWGTTATLITEPLDFSNVTSRTRGFSVLLDASTAAGGQSPRSLQARARVCLCARSLSASLSPCGSWYWYWYWYWYCMAGRRGDRAPLKGQRHDLGRRHL